MANGHTYIILLSLIMFLFSACGDRRCNHADETGTTSNDDREYCTDSGVWSQEDLGLLVPFIPNDIPSQILKRIGYITSYNHETKCPNWVSWHLTAEHTDGPFSRDGVPYYDEGGKAIGIGHVTQETFYGDYFLDKESEEPRQLLSDWPNNEYKMQHGHICPAGDNKWSKAAMNQSYLLTNMCPQEGQLNNGGWKNLEEKCRKWAKQLGDIYIVAGPIYCEGRVSRTIGESEVAVPDAFYKVVLYCGGTPKAIGFIYNNDSSKQHMKDCVCPVDSVEALTGFDFFLLLPDSIEDIVEADANLTKWN